MPAARTMSLDINGKRQTLALDPRTTLLDALREHAGLPGTKKGCDQGASAVPAPSTSTASAC